MDDASAAAYLATRDDGISERGDRVLPGTQLDDAPREHGDVWIGPRSCVGPRRFNGADGRVDGRVDGTGDPGRVGLLLREPRPEDGALRSTGLTPAEVVDDQTRREVRAALFIERARVPARHGQILSSVDLDPVGGEHAGGVRV